MIVVYDLCADNLGGRCRQHDRGRHQNVHRGHGDGQQTVHHQVRVEVRAENGTPQHVDTMSGVQFGRREEIVADESPFAREIRSEGQ